jgi:hypothetical protein
MKAINVPTNCCARVERKFYLFLGIGFLVRVKFVGRVNLFDITKICAKSGRIITTI